MYIPSVSSRFLGGFLLLVYANNLLFKHSKCTHLSSPVITDEPTENLQSGITVGEFIEIN